MSIRELENIITKLEKTKGMKAGACKCTKAGRRKKRGGEILEAGVITGAGEGQPEDFSGSGLEGGEVLGMDGSGIVTGAGKKKGRKKKCGGEIQDMSGSGVTGGRTSGGAVPAQLQNWLAHVKAVRAKNPGVAYKQILQMAKQSYK